MRVMASGQHLQLATCNCYIADFSGQHVSHVTMYITYLTKSQAYQETSANIDECLYIETKEDFGMFHEQLIHILPEVLGSPHRSHEPEKASLKEEDVAGQGRHTTRVLHFGIFVGCRPKNMHHRWLTKGRRFAKAIVLPKTVAFLGSWLGTR